MPTVTGSITSKENYFTGEFNISGIIYTASGTFDRPVPAFNCATATLVYADETELYGPKIFHKGTVGPADINLSLDNSTKITGKLDNPVKRGCPVDGTVVWMKA